MASGSSKADPSPTLDSELTTALRKPVYKNPAVLRLLVTALLAEIGYAVLNLSTMPVYLRNTRGMSEVTVSWVVVAFLLSEAVMKSPMGHLADKVNRKKFLIFGPLVSFFTSLLSLAVPFHWGWGEIVSFMGLRVLDGLGAAMLWPAAFASMGDAVDDEDRQSAMSLLNLCYMLGIALALPVSGIVNDLARNPGASLFMAALLFLLVSLSAVVFAPSNQPKVHVVVPGEHSEVGFSDLLRAIKTIPQYLIIAVVVFMGMGFPATIIKLFAEDVFQMSESKFGALVFPGAIAMAALSVPLSRYGEKLGRAKAVHVGLLLSAIGLGLITVGMFVPFLRVPWLFALGGIPAGLGFLLTIPAWFAAISDIDSERRGANLGAVMTAQGVGMIIGAPIGGFLYERMQPVGRFLHLGSDFGRYSPFAACTFALVCGWIISLRVLRD